MTKVLFSNYHLFETRLNRSNLKLRQTIFKKNSFLKIIIKMTKVLFFRLSPVWNEVEQVNLRLRQKRCHGHTTSFLFAITLVLICAKYVENHMFCFIKLFLPFWSFFLPFSRFFCLFEAFRSFSKLFEAFRGFFMIFLFFLCFLFTYIPVCFFPLLKHCLL